MFIVAVRGTNSWFECKTEIDAARKVNLLLEEYPQHRILVAEELALTVVDGDVTIEEGEYEDN